MCMMYLCVYTYIYMWMTLYRYAEYTIIQILFDDIPYR